MEQLTAFFENINWDAVMSVITEYITKFDFKVFSENVTQALYEVIGYVIGMIMQ